MPKIFIFKIASIVYLKLLTKIGKNLNLIKSKSLDSQIYETYIV